MTKEQAMVHEFHVKNHVRSGVWNSKKQGVLSRVAFLEELINRIRLINEEASEFSTAVNKEDIVLIVDALCDLLYVTYGTADSLGIDLEPLFAEVHRSNMTKNGGMTGLKVNKGEAYQPPELIPILRELGVRL